MNYQLELGESFWELSPDGVHTYLQTLLLGTAGRWRPPLCAWIIALTFGSIVGVLRTMPFAAGWCGSATSMSSCSATFRCWCRCSSGTSCCRRSCRSAIGTWLKQLPNASFYTAVVCLGLYTSARVAEQVRAGILSLRSGQRHGRARARA